VPFPNALHVAVPASAMRLVSIQHAQDPTVPNQTAASAHCSPAVSATINVPRETVRMVFALLKIVRHQQHAKTKTSVKVIVRTALVLGLTVSLVIALFVQAIRNAILQTPALCIIKRLRVFNRCHAHHQQTATTLAAVLLASQMFRVVSIALCRRL
jgi:hypothetical protein